MAPTEWTSAEREGDLEAALCEFDWSNAFVREVSAVSPSRLLPDGSVVAAEVPADLLLTIVAPCGPLAGIELHLHETRSVAVPFDQDLFVTAKVSRTEVWLSLVPNGISMSGRALRWRILDRAEAEAVGRYGRLYPVHLGDDPRLWRRRD
jgi:hypothetical protein